MSNFWRYFKQLGLNKKLFWLYLVLIFVEGAMRKWFMPGLSDLWMMSREPIVMWTVLSLMWTRHLRSNVAKAFMVIGLIMLITTLTFGHGDIAVALFGFRIWFLHIPYIFIMAQLLNRNDLIWICRFLLIVFLPMTVLYVVQWASPPNTWVNAAIKGVISEMKETANGAVRPSGTFGFNKAASYYNPVVVALFTATCFSKYYRERLLVVKHSFFLLCIAVIVTLITSVSRGAIVLSAITLTLVSVVLLFIGNPKRLTQMAFGLLVICATFAIFSNVSIEGKTLLAPITSRFETAAEVEGGADGIIGARVIEPYAFWRDKGEPLDPPIFGYGIGAGSNFGTKRLHLGDAWGLGEWTNQIVTNEMGLIFGCLVCLLRLGFCVYCLPKAFHCASRRGDILPICLWTLSIEFFSRGDINLVMTLGWVVILMILLIASIRLSVNTGELLKRK